MIMLYASVAFNVEIQLQQADFNSHFTHALKWCPDLSFMSEYHQLSSWTHFIKQDWLMP